VQGKEMVLRDQVLMASSVGDMLKQAELLVASGLLPKEVDTAQKAFAIMMVGRELSVPPMTALRQIYVTKKGVPALQAQLIGALIFRDGHTYRVKTLTTDECVIEFKRKEWTEWSTHTVTMAEAVEGHWDSNWDYDKQKWTQKQPWKAFPKAMLFSRCLSAGARLYTPDSLLGMYTVEEITANSIVVEGNDDAVDGVIIKEEVEEKPKEEKQKKEEERAPPETGKFSRPMSPDVLKSALATKAKKASENPVPIEVLDAVYEIGHQVIAQANLPGDDKVLFDQAMTYLWGQPQLDIKQVRATHAWLVISSDKGTKVDPSAEQELILVIKQNKGAENVQQ
jgi:hypothetical protein